jgi:hypothetical protein
MVRIATAAEPAVLGFASPDVCARLSLARSTLNSWATRDPALIQASLADATGRRATRYWSVDDFVLVRVVKSLRQAGCPYEHIERARDLLRESWTDSGDSPHLYWNGDDIITIDNWDGIESRLRQRGQYLMHHVATPLTEWRAHAASVATRFSLIAMNELRDRREQTRATTTSRLEPTAER